LRATVPSGMGCADEWTGLASSSTFDNVPFQTHFEPLLLWAQNAMMSRRYAGAKSSSASVLSETV